MRSLLNNYSCQIPYITGWTRCHTQNAQLNSPPELTTVNRKLANLTSSFHVWRRRKTLYSSKLAVIRMLWTFHNHFDGDKCLQFSKSRQLNLSDHSFTTSVSVFSTWLATSVVVTVEPSRHSSKLWYGWMYPHHSHFNGHTVHNVQRRPKWRSVTIPICCCV